MVFPQPQMLSLHPLPMKMRLTLHKTSQLTGPWPSLEVIAPSSTIITTFCISVIERSPQVELTKSPSLS